MSIEDRSSVEYNSAQWFNGGLDQIADWNGRELFLLDRDIYLVKDLSCHFHKSRFSQEGQPVFIASNEGGTSSSTQQSVSYDVNVKTDHGTTTVQGSASYSSETKDERGNSDKVTIEGKASVDSRGHTSQEVNVRCEKTF